MPLAKKMSGTTSLLALPFNSRFTVREGVASSSFLPPNFMKPKGHFYILLILLASILLLPSGLLGQTLRQIDFLRNLPDKGIATFEDGCRGIAAVLKIPLPDPSFEKVAEELLARKIIRKEWTANPNTTLTWGRISYMVCRALKIRGGLTMTLIGPTERYAYRECIDKGLMPKGNKARFLTGADLMAVLHQMEVYIREHKSP